MNAKDLRIEHIYRAKKPRLCGSVVNDRTIVHINLSTVYYDSPSVRKGAAYSSTPISRFLAWADRDVTEERVKTDA